ncbi:unnamed protein product, partial [marine sediment metagenome]
LEEGWDDEIGLETEIVPLTRPYGLWTGNLFTGVVKVKGKPVPYAEVEVEYYNKDGTIRPPADPYVTQVVKADKNGVFSYAMPKAGWWAFAALNEASWTIKRPNGEDKPVEIGAVYWVRTRESEVKEVVQLDLEQIKKIIDTSLDEKLKPIMRQLTRVQQKEVSFTEVVGGIGYIFGIMGIILYFTSKKKKGEKKNASTRD